MNHAALVAIIEGLSYCYHHEPCVFLRVMLLLDDRIEQLAAAQQLSNEIML